MAPMCPLHRLSQHISCSGASVPIALHAMLPVRTLHCMEQANRAVVPLCPLHSRRASDTCHVVAPVCTLLRAQSYRSFLFHPSLLFHPVLLNGAKYSRMVCVLIRVTFTSPGSALPRFLSIQVVLPVIVVVVVVVVVGFVVVVALADSRWCH